MPKEFLKWMNLKQHLLNRKNIVLQDIEPTILSKKLIFERIMNKKIEGKISLTGVQSNRENKRQLKLFIK